MSDVKKLSAKEISVIVDACGRNGVKELRFGDLAISFSGLEADTPHEILENIHYPAQTTEPQTSQDLDDDDEPDLDQLAIENPSLWHRMKTMNEI